jgi:benzoyl-CoA reductase/2-hydroxyglutaryl-CoA dehydratase subunit BcrC/BadD/HgdB
MRIDRNNIKFIRKILKIPIVYPLGKFIIKSKFYSDKVTLISYEYALELIKKNYNNKNKVVFINILTPTEILYALNLFPLLPEVASAFTSSLGFSDTTLFDSEEIIYSKDLCSVHRNVIGLLKDYMLPNPDFIIFTSHPCHSAVHSFYLISQIFGGEYFPITIPIKGNSSIEYSAKEIENIFFLLANRLKIKNPIRNLEKTIKLSNDARRYLMEINELRKNFLVIDGKNFLDYAGMIFSTFGSIWGVRFFKTLRDEIKSRIKKGKFISCDKRIYWLHLGPYFKTDFFDWLRSKSCCIVFEESSKVYWDELDPKDPFVSIAKKIINANIFSNVEDRFKLTLEGVREYKADGVVIFNQWGCRQGAGNSYILRKRLIEKGIPTIVIDGDLIDASNFPKEQIKTRLEAFLEVI